jgi:hypothetical protein
MGYIQHSYLPNQQCVGKIRDHNDRPAKLLDSSCRVFQMAFPCSLLDAIPPQVLDGCRSANNFALRFCGLKKLTLSAAVLTLMRPNAYAKLYANFCKKPRPN